MLSPLPFQDSLIQPSKFDSCTRNLVTESDVYHDIGLIVSASVSPIPSDSPTLDEDRLSSPTSPPGTTPNFQYGHRMYDEPVSPGTMYDSDQPAPPPQVPFSYESTPNQTQNYSQSALSSLRDSDPPAPSYLSDSPSPVDVHSSSTLTQSMSSSYTSQDRYPHRSSISGRYQTYPPNYLDQRRMSEPSVHYPVETEGFRYTEGTPSTGHAPPRAVGYLQRGASLRDLRQQYQSMDYPTCQPVSPGSNWRSADDSFRPNQEPISPYQPNFSGSNTSPTAGISYSQGNEDHYGPSPPGTGTSTSSAPSARTSTHKELVIPPQGVHQSPTSPHDSDASKRYSFVALAGNAVKKRPRRRYDEIERLYQCTWPDCNKAYGTLNHLNAHVTMQKHGPKRSPNEFKELRKQWRKAKKESEFPSSNLMRRSSMGRLGDEIYDSRYQHQRYSYPPPLNILPSGVSMSHVQPERYSVADDIRYPSDDRSHRIVERTNYDERNRYSAPSGWQPPPPSSYTRSQSQYPSVPFPPPSSLVAQHSLHPVPPNRSEYVRPTSPSPPVNRLPPNSTLLTPLPGYEPPTSLPLPSLDPSIDLDYANEGYYDDESGRRPGSGHAGVSGDEY
ncbi:Zn finger family DNA binding protein [Desarmillaria tabescens]|uniref:Zn finger family DNA binding protein n=1 Tax=Armillaria tabescens TaxID=1929756 RepID=A0AA39NK56_ARMTA|nr:Zn finger family DNA binding protein [Desarmillaria tabescens]KAK0467133.1 Zn finger family DNA binding protein [Desarmillaria tabescens]